MVKVNGEQLLVDDLLLVDFLLQNDYEPKKIAVEINGEIVPKSRFSEKRLMDGDEVEIVNFVGGG